MDGPFQVKRISASHYAFREASCIFSIGIEYKLKEIHEITTIQIVSLITFYGEPPVKLPSPNKEGEYIYLGGRWP